MNTYVMLYRKYYPNLWDSVCDTPVCCFIKAENIREAAKELKSFLEDDIVDWNEPTVSFLIETPACYQRAVIDCHNGAFYHLYLVQNFKNCNSSDDFACF